MLRRRIAGNGERGKALRGQRQRRERVKQHLLDSRKDSRLHCPQVIRYSSLFCFLDETNALPSDLCGERAGPAQCPISGSFGGFFPSADFAVLVTAMFASQRPPNGLYCSQDAFKDSMRGK